MRHLESGRKIILSEEVTMEQLKERLVEKLKNIMQIEMIGDRAEEFSVTGLYRPRGGSTNNTRIDLDISLKHTAGSAKIMVEGNIGISKMLVAVYGLSLILVLLLGLLPGSINTGPDGSAIDAFVFLFLGAFMVYDVNKRLAEPEYQVDRILKNLDVEFG